MTFTEHKVLIKVLQQKRGTVRKVFRGWTKNAEQEND